MSVCSTTALQNTHPWYRSGEQAIKWQVSVSYLDWSFYLCGIGGTVFGDESSYPCGFSEWLIPWRSFIQLPFHWSSWLQETDMMTVFDLASASILSWILGSPSYGVESGQSLSSSNSHDGAFHHCSECTSVAASTPRESRFEGFSTPGQCCHQLVPENFLIASIWFMTNGFHLLGFSRIHPSATSESTQNIFHHDQMWRKFLSFSPNRAANNELNNSNLGRVVIFFGRGAAFVLLERKWMLVPRFFFWSLAYATAP